MMVFVGWIHDPSSLYELRRTNGIIKNMANLNLLFSVVQFSYKLIQVIEMVELEGKIDGHRVNWRWSTIWGYLGVTFHKSLHSTCSSPTGSGLLSAICVDSCKQQHNSLPFTCCVTRRTRGQIQPVASLVDSRVSSMFLAYARQKQHTVE